MKWNVNKCKICGFPHVGISSKVDKKGTEYVICPYRGNRINVKRFKPKKFIPIGELVSSKWWREEL